jgi:polyhydroxybutyrate depolymerase
MRFESGRDRERVQAFFQKAIRISATRIPNAVFGFCFVAAIVVNLACHGQDASINEAASEGSPVKLGPGDHVQTLMVGEQKRTYLVHVPERYDSKTPTPLVVALHGAGMNGSMMSWFCDMNKTSDAKGFIVVYPSGTGTGSFLTWNAGGLIGKLNGGRADDVAFVSKLFDEMSAMANIDQKRIYVCGLSNGGMMSYRLASEISDRIAAIAAVAGTMTTDEFEPKRPIPVMHFHGTKDTIVPYGPPYGTMPPVIKLKGAEETVETCATFNGCDKTPVIDTLSKDTDKTKVTRKTYGGGKNGTEVILVTIEDGGHTWPGRQLPIGFLGKAARNISANELIWEFFEKHPLP